MDRPDRLEPATSAGRGAGWLAGEDWRRKRGPAGTRGGFSLLEMIVCLAIIAVLAGLFALRFGETRDEEILSPAAAGVKRMARQAIARASAYREDYAIVFQAEEMILARGHGLGRRGATVVEAEDSQAIPAGAILEIRWPGEERWSGAAGQAWLFRSGGLCEPLQIRLSTQRSRAFIELAFDPLTAQAEESAYFP